MFNYTIFFKLLFGASLLLNILTEAGRYESLDDIIFEKFEEKWVENHFNWIGVKFNSSTCDPKTTVTSYPICFRNTSIDPSLPLDSSCPNVQCIKKTFFDSDSCYYTPSDTIDYLPPVAQSTLDNQTICRISQEDTMLSSISFSLDQGIPPLFIPINAVRLEISGVIKAQFNDRCEVVSNAEITAWQVDPQALDPFTVDTQYEHNLDEKTGETISSFTPARTNLGNHNQSSLRAISCRATQHSDSIGKYSFNTVMPPSYGPPRHIMFRISAPGFEVLTTRMYFDQDFRLQQLTTLEGNTEHGKGLKSFPLALGFNTEDSPKTQLFEEDTGEISKDPRVTKLKFHPTSPLDTSSTPVTAASVTGYFSSDFTITLRPLRERGSNTEEGEDKSTMPPIPLDGLWIDPRVGTLVSVETHGDLFVASEYPHSRTWGTIQGSITGDTIRGVDFRGTNLQQGTGKKQQQYASLDYFTTLWSDAGVSTGLILNTDSFSTAPFDPKQPLETTILWSGGSLEQELRWTRYNQDISSSADKRGFRYLKLLITRETGSERANEGSGGQMVINEIEFYQGFFAQLKHPRDDMMMMTPRTPAPQKVTCSSFIDQDHHCFKAFDGDRSSGSSWVTESVGSRRNKLSQPQWVTFDFGADSLGIAPTALRIVCDVENSVQGVFSSAGARGCPMTFSLLGSHDNVRFDVIYQQDLFDYDGEYQIGTEGFLFYFVFDTTTGRLNGQRCGSCDSGPLFQCHLQAYDGSCASRYCGEKARCATRPVCPVGEYMTFGFNSFSRPAFQCKQCAPGRFGSIEGLTSRNCSGLCNKGHFCPAGSVSPTAHVCGDPSVFCPEGSGKPTLGSAGRFTVEDPSLWEGFTTVNDIKDYTNVSYFESIPVLLSTDDNTTNIPENSTVLRYPLNDGDGTTQTGEFLCPPGYYCSNGAMKACPVGRYGSVIGLQRPECSAACVAGTYCLAGSVIPTSCEPGFFCPDGVFKVECPAGTFGSDYGLKDRRCSGLCSPGFYCPIGSIENQPCPSGRFGSVSGLTNRSCSGLCEEGYYCPTASVSKRAFECGGSEYFCPEGSSTPEKVTLGYYTVGGDSPMTRSSQKISEKGYFSSFGRRWTCPAGSYGEVEGLASDAPLDLYKLFLSNTTEFNTINTLSPTSSPSIGTRRLQQNNTDTPTLLPTSHPTSNPTTDPSLKPTIFISPSLLPTALPTYTVTANPTVTPTVMGQPSSCPSATPTGLPSAEIFSSFSPTFAPSEAGGRPLSVFYCSGLCKPGFYCPEKSTSPEEVPCPAGRYGSTEGLADEKCTALCPLGHYCPEGSVSPILCPSGYFGNSTGLTDISCSSEDCWTGGCNKKSNLCWEGYFCPEGSVRGDQRQCGSTDKYCPRGSSLPLPVTPGYYSINTITTASSAAAPENAFADQRGLTQTDQRICEEGSFCVDGVKSKCPPGFYGAEKGLMTSSCSGLCGPGFYCPEGSTNSTEYRCPAGRYGSISGNKDSSCSGKCASGYYCPEGSTSPFQLPCAVRAVLRPDSPNPRQVSSLLTSALISTAGESLEVSTEEYDMVDRVNVYLTDLNATVYNTTVPASFSTVSGFTPAQLFSLKVLVKPDSVYCPEGSTAPLVVRSGFYSIGTNRTTRNGQLPCPMGSYCRDGIIRSCPAGRYGRAERLSSPECTGLCVKGHYCPTGSVSGTQFPCPAGRYGAEDGLTDQKCSGPCLNPSDCPIGSLLRIPPIT